MNLTWFYGFTVGTLEDLQEGAERTSLGRGQNSNTRAQGSRSGTPTRTYVNDVGGALRSVAVIVYTSATLQGAYDRLRPPRTTQRNTRCLSHGHSPQIDDTVGSENSDNE